MPRKPTYKPVRTVEERNRLVLANQALAVRVAGWFRGKGVDLVDLRQAAFLGMIRAAEDHDPEKARFSTYAVRVMTTFLRNEVEYQSRPVRRPRAAHRTAKKLARAMREIRHEIGKAVRADEAVHRLGLSRLSAAHAVASYHAGRMAFTSEPDVLADLPNHSDDKAPARERVADLLNLLPESDADYLRRYFGIDCEQETPEAIGRRFGISRWTAGIRKRDLVLTLKELAKA
jgi:RNA polymerase sigma factor (sigma-70 family)